jgi:hypothetical protein
MEPLQADSTGSINNAVLYKEFRVRKTTSLFGSHRMLPYCFCACPIPTLAKINNCSVGGTQPFEKSFDFRRAVISDRPGPALVRL